MKATPTFLPGVLILERQVFGDERGFFMESFNQKRVEKPTGTRYIFVQDNYSRSAKGVLRGLHYQLPPHAQSKLVRVTQGRAFDVAVDMRRSSPNFGQWTGVELNAENHRQLWIPPGLAHGFLVLSDRPTFSTKRRITMRPDAKVRCAGTIPICALHGPIQKLHQPSPPRTPQRRYCAAPRPLSE